MDAQSVLDALIPLIYSDNTGNSQAFPEYYIPHAKLADARLHYTIDGEVSNPVLVLFNLLGTSLDTWLPQLERFRKHFRVLRYDTRGHGKSGVVPGPNTIDQLGQDVIALLDYLDVDKAHFCGLSMAGQTGMWIGVHHPERLSRLILANTAASIGPPENWANRINAVNDHGLASIAPGALARWLTPQFAASHPALASELLAMLLATPAAGYTAACSAVRDADLRKNVERITSPTLIISGTFDLPTPPADGHYLQQQIRGALYVEVAAAHISNQERVIPFGDAVLDFLDL